MAYDYRKGMKAEFEAREILKLQGFYVSRCSGHPSPPDLFAARKGDFRLVMVRHSRFPVPDAHAVSIIYAEDLDRFRKYGWSTCIRFECWIHAPPWEWSWYEVYPGGIRRIRQEWETPGEAGIVDEAEFVESAWNDAVETGVGSISIEWIPPSAPVKEERALSGIRDGESVVGQGEDSGTGKGIPDDALMTDEGDPDDPLMTDEGDPDNPLMTDEGDPDDPLMTDEGDPDDPLMTDEGDPDDPLMTDEGDPSGIPSDNSGWVLAETGVFAPISSIGNDPCADSLLSTREERPSKIPSTITRTPLVETGDSIKVSRHRDDQIPNDTPSSQDTVQPGAVNHA